MRRSIRLALLFIAMPCAAQDAQHLVNPALDVRLFPLRNLTPAAAAKLIAPFVFEPNGGVFEAGPGVPGITVRATRAVLLRVDSLLKIYDEPTPTLNIRFQLLVASDSNSREDAIAPEVQASLRSLFRFAGYRLLAQGVTSVGVSNFGLTMNAADERYQVNGRIGKISSDGASNRGSGSVQLEVTLFGSDGRSSMLSTGLTIPIGQAVIVGSAGAGGTADRSGRTLILVVRPEYTTTPAR